MTQTEAYLPSFNILCHAEGLLFHHGFNLPALSVNGVELARQFERFHVIVRGEAAYAQAHIRQSSSGVDSGS
jgi:hypothetical protein